MVRLSLGLGSELGLGFWVVNMFWVMVMVRVNTTQNLNPYQAERWPSGLGNRPATGRSMVRVPLR